VGGIIGLAFMCFVGFSSSREKRGLVHAARMPVNVRIGGNGNLEIWQREYPSQRMLNLAQSAHGKLLWRDEAQMTVQLII